MRHRRTFELLLFHAPKTPSRKSNGETDIQLAPTPFNIRDKSGLGGSQLKHGQMKLNLHSVLEA